MLFPAQDKTPVVELLPGISNLAASTRDPAKPQELVNAKKKRQSLFAPEPPQILPQEPDSPSPGVRGSVEDCTIIFCAELSFFS
jgi:hypothetical protein